MISPEVKNHMSKIGRKGGKANISKHGKPSRERMIELAKLSWQSLKRKKSQSANGSNQ
jgi:hypothetical protein